MKKRILGILILVCMSVLLCGCATTDARLEKKLKASSGLYEDKDYLKYKTMREKGQLDDNGLYLETESLSDNDVHSGNIHLTFARNRFLRIEYFYDEARTERVPVNNCYVNPGDTIYATIKEIDNPYSDAFLFKEFRFAEYSESGNRLRVISGNSVDEDKTDDKKDEDKKDDKKEDKKDKEEELTEEEKAKRMAGAELTIEIPDDFKGTQLAVEPLGEYQKIEVSLSAFLKDKDNKRKAVGGTDFYINDEIVIGDKVKIDAGKEYTVRLSYNGENYYYASSTPKARVADTPGEVIFATSDGKEESASYEVELRPFVTLNFEGSGKMEDLMTLKNTDIKLEGRKIEKLKAGQSIAVDTKGEYRLFCKDIDFTETETDTGYHYQFAIPDTDKSSLTIRISDQMKKVEIPGVEHGRIELKLLDTGFFDDLLGDEETEVLEADEEGETYLEDGDLADGTARVEVSIIPDDGYYVSGRGVSGLSYVSVMRLSVYAEDITDIIREHPILPLLTISLDPNDQYGNCVYRLNGDEVSGTINVKEGDKLTLEYTLTAADMSIARKDGSILSAVIDFGASVINYPSRSETITITESDEGRTFNRSDFFNVVAGKPEYTDSDNEPAQTVTVPDEPDETQDVNTDLTQPDENDESVQTENGDGEAE